jgi:riboflavin synthase
MFTGIITDVGTVRSAEQRGDLRLVVDTRYDTATIVLGASIACSGVCLTVVDKGAGWFAVDVSGESVRRTAAGHWSAGQALNLERALKVGDEIGGHIVTGHVDGVGQIAALVPEGDSQRVAIRVGADLAPYLAAKGSVTLDGISLTVNSVEDEANGSALIAVNIIPHTAQMTSWGTLSVGQDINVEIDVLARYLGRMKERLG